MLSSLSPFHTVQNPLKKKKPCLSKDGITNQLTHQNNPHRHAQRPISQVIPDSIKLRTLAILPPFLGILLCCRETNTDLPCSVLIFSLIPQSLFLVVLGIKCNLYDISFHLFIYLFVCVCKHMPWHMYSPQRTTCGSRFSPSTKWIPRIELRLSGWAASALTC